MITAIANGYLLILTADAESREELKEFIEADEYQRAETLVAEALHEKWTFITPESIGALTDAPILCDDVNYLDDGTVEPVGIIAWFPDYMIVDPWETLANTGQVEFVIASS